VITEDLRERLGREISGRTSEIARERRRRTEEGGERKKEE